MNFDEIFETYFSRIYNKILGMVKNKEDAEDIAQDVFLTVYKNLKKFRNDSGMSLSQRRANAVAEVARASGAVVDRVTGFGERRPIAPNDSAANMQKNRRVEIVCYRYPQ
jgi:outer membrane protein OmpA-like peptidoglycan-associated protein